MQKFTLLKGLVAPMDRDNVDTDAIIPKQFLKSIKRTGFGPNLFDEWRYLDQGEPGCSMCLAMNADRLEPGERCASTSNRNFEGRQGAGGRTHLVSPAMAAAAAIHGHFVDVRKFA